MMHRLTSVVLGVSIVVCTVAPAAADPHASPSCAINTGLDPACPLTAASIDSGSTLLSDTASQHTDTLALSLAWRGDRQISVSLPFYQHLSIAGVGDAFGTGDMGIGYSFAFGGEKRLTQAAGISAVLATGSNQFYSTGRSELIPMYALSYALGDRVTLLAMGTYAFDAGGEKVSLAPATRAFTLTPRAIVDLTRSGLYAAADAQISAVRGDERYESYQADATLGYVRRHIGLAVTYREPVDPFTRAHVFRHAIDAQLSWRL